MIASLVLGCWMAAVSPTAACWAPPTEVIVRASGVGYPPPRMRGAQARLMARRAAEVMAQRNLAVAMGYPDGTRLGGFRYVAVVARPDGSVAVTVEYVLRERPRPDHGRAGP